MALAIGINHQGRIWSIGVKADTTPKNAARKLGERNYEEPPDEILIVKDDKIIKHWKLYDDYEEFLV